MKGMVYMDIILKERGHGKTTDLIQMSAITGNTIVCANPYIVKQKAQELNLEIPEPVTPRNLLQMDTKPSGIYIDELELMLKNILGFPVVGATVSTNDVAFGVKARGIVQNHVKATADECGITITQTDISDENRGTLTKDGVKDVARELLDSLRSRKMQIWQVKEAFRYAIEFADQERLK